MRCEESYADSQHWIPTFCRQRLSQRRISLCYIEAQQSPSQQALHWLAGRPDSGAKVHVLRYRQARLPLSR
jgi:hypothetical protein